MRVCVCVRVFVQHFIQQLGRNFTRENIESPQMAACNTGGMVAMVTT